MSSTLTRQDGSRNLNGIGPARPSIHGRRFPEEGSRRKLYLPMQVRKGTGRKTKGRKGRKGTRRRRGGMFGMNSGLSQAEKDAISKRTTYGDLPAYAIANAKESGTESALKTNDRNRQMLTGYTKGNIAKNILAKTGRRA